MTSEAEFSPPSPWCPNPGRWHADDDQATEHEVTALVAAFVVACQPEIVVETGTNSGQTAEAIGRALARNGHGMLWTAEIDGDLAARAEARCAGLPVRVVVADSATWTPPGPIGFAWLDSSIANRAGELGSWIAAGLFAPGAVVGVHDTGPHHQVAASLAPLIDGGQFTAITLRTPRGVTFGTITGG